jgi:hypothetical protein
MVERGVASRIHGPVLVEGGRAVLDVGVHWLRLRG